MLNPSELQRARQLAREAKGDPLGLELDVEMSRALAEAAARRFFREGPTLEGLEQWSEVIAEIKLHEELPREMAEELEAHEQLIGAFRGFLASDAAARRPSLFRSAVEMAMRVATASVQSMLGRLTQDLEAEAP